MPAPWSPMVEPPLPCDTDEQHGLTEAQASYFATLESMSPSKTMRQAIDKTKDQLRVEDRATF